MHNTNATRQKILTDIDQFGVAYVPSPELDLSFRHADHCQNWAALWNLVKSPSTVTGLTAFRRRTLGNAVRETP